MTGFIQKYKWFILAAVVAIAALVIAFLSGGSVREAAKQAKERQPAAVVATSGDLNEEADTVAADNAPESTTAPPAENTAASTTASAPSGVPASSAPAATASASVQATHVPEHTPPQPNNSVALTQPATRPQQPATAPPKPTEAATKPAVPAKPVCTISISCATILHNMDKLDSDLHELVPSDGWLLKPTKVTLRQGETVFDVLKRVCKQKKIHMEFSDSPVYHSAYIEGIGNLYEFDCGANSGWMFSVNGTFPSVGCSQVSVKNGDVIEWKYTCNLGYDVGGGAR